MKHWALLSLSVIACSACGSGSLGTSRGSIAAVVGANEHQLEVAETSRELVKREILDAPRSFEVSLADDAYSWDRARFFLENYAHTSSTGRSAVIKINGSQWALASHPASEEYRYEVVKELTAGRYVYTVSCRAGSGGDQRQARLNEGNLARFVRDGQLEVSLLKSEAV